MLFQVDSPLNLKHPHDVVIFMRQETRVNYLKKLEVCEFHFYRVMCNDVEQAGFTLGSHSGPKSVNLFNTAIQISPKRTCSFALTQISSIHALIISHII